MRYMKDSPMPKVIKAISKQRTNHVAEMITAGYRRYHIVQYGMKEWGLSERGVDKYIGKANAEIIARTSQDLDHYLAVGIRRCGDVFRRAMKEDRKRIPCPCGIVHEVKEKPNLLAAMAAVKELNSMLKITEHTINLNSKTTVYEVKLTEEGIPIKTTEQLTDAEANKLIAANAGGGNGSGGNGTGESG